MRAPEISIVIPVYKEPDSLPKTLDNLAYQTFIHRAEIILCNYDPTGGSYVRNILRDFHANFEVPLRFVQIFQPGIAFARNEGFLRAQGEILCNFDADCYWSVRDGLERMTQPIFYGDAVITNCDNLLDLSEVPKKRLNEPHMTWIIHQMKLNNWVQSITPVTISDPGTCMRRDVYFEVGGYQEEAGETSKLSPRIAWKYPTGTKNVKGVAVYQSPRRALKGKEIGNAIFDYDYAIRGKETKVREGTIFER